MEDSPNSPTSEFLRSEFTKSIQQIHGDEGAAQAWSNSLIKAYSEPQRHYHTASHISSMLQLFQAQRHLITNPIVLQLAIYFHDWVYDPKAHDNELQSISVFKAFAAQLNLDGSLIETASHYIEATITHSLKAGDDGDEDLKLFLDFGGSREGKGGVRSLRSADKAGVWTFQPSGLC
jgi:predicted metal-dependent HD superfamily phosphohydrolase